MSMYGKLPRQIVSKFGYQGCLASLEFNGEAADPINNALVPSEEVNEGCEGRIAANWVCFSPLMILPLFGNK